MYKRSEIVASRPKEQNVTIHGVKFSDSCRLTAMAREKYGVSLGFFLRIKLSELANDPDNLEGVYCTTYRASALFDVPVRKLTTMAQAGIIPAKKGDNRLWQIDVAGTMRVFQKERTA